MLHLKFRTVASVKSWLLLVLSAGLALVGRTHAATTNFFEGFEKKLGREWAVGDANPFGKRARWGIVGRAFGDFDARDGKRKLYCAGVGHAGRAKSPRYRDQMTTYLQRSIDLTGYSNAVLSFWFRMPSVETNYDALSVSIDSTVLWSCSSAVQPWTEVRLSLSDFVGGAHVLKFQFESDQNIAFEGCYLDDILVASGPLNDPFTNAVQFSGGSGAITNNNSDATAEPGEPDAGNSIWFRWTARTNGTVAFNTAESSFPTLVCVYTGDRVDALVPVACSETNSASFEAVSGTSYQISVRGVANAQGTVVLQWDQPNGYAHDLLPDLTVWADETRSYLYGWYLDENQQPGRVLLRLATATPNSGEGKLELRGSSEQPGVYQRIYRDDGTWRDRYAGTFTFHPGHQHLHYDDWMNFHLRSVTTNDGVGDVIASGDKISFAILDLIHYDASLPGSPKSPQFTGGLTQGLSVGWADVYGANLIDQWIDVTDVAPGRYWLEGVVDPKNNVVESNESNNVSRIMIDLTTSNAPAPPLRVSSTNVPPGSAVTFTVTNVGSGFHWQHQGANLVDDTYHTGVHTPTLTLNKVQAADSGAYSVVITNAFGAITSAPANLIVVDHARVVYAPELSAQSGGVVRVPIGMQSVGNEHTISFTVRFDPAVLLNARLGAVPDGASFSMDTNAAGALGLTITLPKGEVFPHGDVLIAEITFDVANTSEASTGIGFGSARAPQVVSDSNFVSLPALFVAGEITISARYGAVTR